jgi:hypothetical protein
MILKMLTWVNSKLKADSVTKDPFGDDPFVVL